MDAEHLPVMAHEVVELLAPWRGGVFVDATVGLGGHAERLLDASPDVRLVGIDRDPEARHKAATRLAPYGQRVHLLAGDFADLGGLLAPLALPPPAGILADLGVSSLQLDTARRGFSFRRDGPLDMRMGDHGPTAAEVVNGYSEEALERIFRTYGEERQARRLARGIAAARRQEPISTTGQLAELIYRLKGGTSGPRRGPAGRRGTRPGGPGGREGRVDPATRVFQALRIEVNRELAALPRFLDEAVQLLEQEGRLVVISYHSLEDRIVKNALRDLARGEVDQVTGRPRAETRLIEVLTKKPLRPTPAEVAANPRSRSARLRAARRL